MGFHLRKSFKVGALRFNLSNSGLGFSVGPKGLRFGVDGKGRSYIGGGKGILRYKKHISGKNNNKIKINKEHLPVELKYTLVNWMDVINIILFTPLILFVFLITLGALFAPKFEFGVFICFLIMLCLMFLPFKKFTSKKTKLLKAALISFAEANYEYALKNYNDLKQYKFRDYDSNNFISNQIYECYIFLNDYKGAYEFLKQDLYVSGRREKIVQCLYKLEDWEELIYYLQNSYDEKEKEEHPIYYAMLGNAFLKQGKKEIALETMLQGPVKKRTMNTEMCAFRYTLGECYEAKEDKENALKQYQKVYAYDINYENIQDKIKELA